MADKIKYTVALPKKVADALEELSDAESMSKPETLRRAIALYHHIYQEVIKGKKRLCIVDENENIKKEIVFS
jgi:hypothetical protein